MAVKRIRVDGEVDGSLGGLRVRATRLTGGIREGILQIELSAGATKAIILPDRGLGIWKMFVGDVALGWQSPVRGPVHPRFVPLGEPSGIGWLDGFDELVTRCGLVSNGAPDFEPNGRLKHGLHGRIANLPACDVEAVLDDTAGTVVLTGTVEETRFLVHSLRMRTALTLHASAPRLAWSDTIENFSERPATMQMLYHVNLGPPLLGAGAEVVVPLAELAPRDAAAVADVPSWNRYDAPRAGRGEEVHFMSLVPDAAGRSTAMLTSADGGRAASLSWRAAELPCFTLWKNQGGLADGYVTGLEPGTNYPNPRSFEETQGRVVPLAPQASVTFDLAIEYLTGDSVATARRRLAPEAAAAPRIDAGPRRGWSNV